MKSLTILATAAFLTSSAAFAQTMSAGGSALLSSVPATSHTVTDWYKQDIYDTQNNKIGAVSDVLLGQDGQVSALIVGVGGFLGAGEKEVAVNFSSVKETMKNSKMYLTMDTSKDALKAAPGFKYDSDKTAWVPDTSKK
jgi:sporulation protein YlmC with PRC-barrel domain